VANLIGVELKKASSAREKAVLVKATLELMKVADANMSELRKVLEAMAAAMASGADERTAAAKGRNAVDVDLTD
jgi:hypothetical protein